MADEKLEENITSDEEPLARFYAPYDVVPLVLCVLIVAANATAILLVLRSAKLRNATNGVLVSLAVSDLLAGVVGVPLYLACTTSYDTGCCVASVLVWRFVSISTVLHLTLVTADRYVSIVHVTRYETIVTGKASAVLVAIVWICAASVSLVQLCWVGLQQATDGEEHQTVVYSIVVLVVFLGLPLVTMLYSYARILACVLHFRSKQKASTTAKRPSKTDPLDRIMTHWKTALVFAAMIIVFIVCWVPYFTLEVLYNSHKLDSLPVWAWYVLFYYTRFAASLVNPLIYIFGKQDLRAALLECFGCSHTPITGESTTNDEIIQSRV